MTLVIQPQIQGRYLCLKNIFLSAIFSKRRHQKKCRYNFVIDPKEDSSLLGFLKDIMEDKYQVLYIWWQWEAWVTNSKKSFWGTYQRACHYLTHVSFYLMMSQVAPQHNRKMREKHLRMKVSIRVRVETPDVGSRESVSVSCSSCSNHSQEPDNSFLKIWLNFTIGHPQVTSSEVMSAGSSRTSLNRWNEDSSVMNYTLSMLLELLLDWIESVQQKYSFILFFHSLSRTSSLVSQLSQGARSGSGGASARSVESTAAHTSYSVFRSGWTVVRVGEETDENKQGENFF